MNQCCPEVTKSMTLALTPFEGALWDEFHSSSNIELYERPLTVFWDSKGKVTLSVSFGIDVSVKVPDNLSHFSRHDLAYFKARSSIFLYMSHVSVKLNVLLRFFENINSFLSTASFCIKPMLKVMLIRKRYCAARTERHLHMNEREILIFWDIALNILWFFGIR